MDFIHSDQFLEHYNSLDMMDFGADDKIMAKYPYPEGDSLVTVTVSTQTPQKKCESKRRKVGLSSISKRVLDFDGQKDEAAIAGGNQTESSWEIESNLRFESVLRCQLVSWTEKLLKLQPKVHMSPHIMESGLYLFKSLRQRQLKLWVQGRLPKSYISNRDLMVHDLAACWWIAMKHCSVRTAVPNRSLLSRATDSKCSLLAECEISALSILNWDVNIILRENGLIKTSDT